MLPPLDTTGNLFGREYFSAITETISSVYRTDALFIQHHGFV
jgi:hypothetical protein